MALTQDQVGNVTVVRPEGRIDSVTAAEFQSDLLAVVEGASSVVIDCANVSYVSSAGLRVFLIAAKQAQGKGGKIALCALNDSVGEIFLVSGFAKIINIHTTLDQALA